MLYYLIRYKKYLDQADMAELVDALDLGSSIFDVRVRVSLSALQIKTERAGCGATCPFRFVS